MNRRGFLGALGGALAALGLKPKKKPVEIHEKWTATEYAYLIDTEHVHYAYHPGRPTPEEHKENLMKVFRWLPDRMHGRNYDAVNYPADAEQGKVTVFYPEFWRVGDIWLNVDSGEKMLCTFSAGKNGSYVELTRGVLGTKPAYISCDDVLHLVGSLKQEG